MPQQSLLQQPVQDFIAQHLTADCSKLALQKNPFPELSWQAIIQQIQSKQKCFGKLPTWYTSANLIYPPKISVEQSSSEQTAAYKASLVEGKSLIDLTGGMGVDAYYFAARFSKVTHCELTAELSLSVQHNFAQFNKTNVAFVAGDSISYLNESKEKYDWIYIDPSRRNEAKGKVFVLEDCLPNVIDHLDLLFAHSQNILLKTAPLLDITAGLRTLSQVIALHIVAVENEVKELLWVLQKDSTLQPEIHCINLVKTGIDKVVFEWNAAANCLFSLPLTYLYEPNHAIMKSGKFLAVAEKFGLFKLHEHSHLYTHHQCFSFPGRVFTIVSQLAYSKTEMKKLAGTKANISTRNFPDSVEEIRKKWKITVGGNLFYFFTTDLHNQKIVLLCTKIESSS